MVTPTLVAGHPERNQHLPGQAAGVLGQLQRLGPDLRLKMNQTMAMQLLGKTVGCFWLVVCLAVSNTRETDCVANQQQHHHFDRRAQHRLESAIPRFRRHQEQRTQLRVHRSVTAERWLLLRQQAPPFVARIMTTRLDRIRYLDLPWRELLGRRAMPVRKDQTLHQARSSKS